MDGGGDDDPSAPIIRGSEKGADAGGRQRSIGVYVGLGVTLAAMVLVLVAVFSHEEQPRHTYSDCPIFCESDILDAVQNSGIFNSSKEFVDMPLKHDPDTVLKRFHELPDRSAATLRGFLAENFNPPGQEMREWKLPDWHDSPPPAFLKGIADLKLRAWASEVHAIWPSLARTIDPKVAKNPQRYSLLSLPHGVIVPGGRFREVYYWDTYWIVRGLLVAEMTETAKLLVLNLLSLVKEWGFVPNGNRRYYLNRSQPPMLVAMVEAVFDVTQDEEFLVEALPLLDQEYRYWMHPGERAVVLAASDDGRLVDVTPLASPSGPTPYSPRFHATSVWDILEPQHCAGTSAYYVLNRYFASVTHPRPESYVEDENTARNASAANDPLRRAKLYSELAAGAETGWDYSSRWFSDRTNLVNISTSSVIPADLNAIMYRNELTLYRFHSQFGSASAAQSYLDAAQKRHKAISELLYNPQSYQWHDLIEADARVLSPEGVLSNFIPLWCGCHLPPPFAGGGSRSPVSHDLHRIVGALLNSTLIMEGGAATTAPHFDTGQQWDYPNGWAPLQHMIIEGLQQFALDIAHELAFSMAQAWILSNYVAFNQTSHMFEKYDCRSIGGEGSGGEYTLQWGFGWTNGVAFVLLDMYGDRLISRQ